MIKQPAIQVNSEIGTLREVLLHRPGAEIEILRLIRWNAYF
ncbi:arginine deiminase [Weissella viridescens]|uniref:Arginine deiminase n=1 Tax=Weissella viridescens TaxID=1629 RepID=A0A380P6N5_WEIVI|nr:arginine deiminase [Weissella viridescens]